jgi:Uma2 family endonuclease
MVQLLGTDQTATPPTPSLDSPDFDPPNIDHLVLEDDTPVDNFQSEIQQRLLVEPLYSSEVLPAPFLVAANVGLFYKLKGDPIVPDVMLSLGIQRPEDFSKKQNRSYLVWELGKLPEICLEIVSNQEGDELTLSRRSQQKGKTTAKKDLYAQIGIPYYIVFDPLQQLQGPSEMDGALLRVWFRSPTRYSELTSPEGLVAAGQSVWLEDVELGLTLWEGEFEENVSRLWLRWCDRQGQVIPTGKERADAEHERADAEHERADRLADRLRALGVDPDQV